MPSGQDPRLRLLIIDDAPVVLERLAELAAEVPHLLVVASTTSGRDGLALCERLRPDAVLVDVMVKDLGGAALIAAIRARRPSAAVLVLTDIPMPGLVRHWVAAGADAVFVLPSEAGALVSALRLIAPPSGGRHV